MYVYYGVLVIRGTAAWQVPLYQLLLPNASHVAPTWSHLGPLVQLGFLLVSWAPEKLPKQVKNQHFLIFVRTWFVAVWEPSWRFLGSVLCRLWNVLGSLGGVLESLGTSCAVSSGRLGVDLGRLKGVSGHLLASWDVLAASWGRLGASWRHLEASWGVLGERL